MSSPLPPVASRSGGLRGNLGDRRYDGEEVGAEIGAGRAGVQGGEGLVLARDLHLYT